MTHEPQHDKTNKMACAPSEDSDQPGHPPNLWESSLSAWRKLGPLATHWAHSEDSDQTGRMPRLIWVFAGRTATLLVLSRGGSNVFDCLFFLFMGNALQSFSVKELFSWVSACAVWLYAVLNELLHEKTCLRGLRPGKTQTGLLSYRD